MIHARSSRPRVRIQRETPPTPSMMDMTEFVDSLKKLQEMRAAFESHARAFMDNMRVELERQRTTMKRGPKGESGLRGPKGEKPTRAELEEIIRPLIPAPIKGDKGEKGDRGEDGKSATQPDIEKIAKKVARLVKGDIPKTEAIVAIVAKVFQKKFDEEVKRFNRDLSELRSKIMLGSGGGGGMGTIKYFKFTGDGSTTQFTLPDFPTQEGNATFAHVNGPRIHNNEHFTVSGKTLTTLQTLNDGDILDGWIIT